MYSGNSNRKSGKLRVLFDLSIVPHAVGGVSRYLLSLSNALSEVTPEMEIDFVTVDVPAVHSGVKGPEIDCVTLKTPFYLEIPFFRRFPLRRKWEEKSRATRLKKYAESAENVIYQHSGVQPEFPDGSKSVITIYDLSAIENPQWHTKETVEYVEREAELIASGSSILAISKWSGRRASEYFGLPLDRIYSAGGAARRIFSPGRPSERLLNGMNLDPGRYLLHVGNFVPRKNIPFLLRVYAAAREKGVKTPLVLVGAGGWGGLEITENPGVRIFRNISDSAMVELYRGARALLCPSRYEGLGLPVLEAFACGTPVISSNAAALRETVGNNGILLEPDDEDGWINEITELEDTGRVEELTVMSSGAVRKSWLEIAEGVCGFYRRISGK